MGGQPAAIPIGPGLWRVPTAPFDLVNSFLVLGRDDRLTLVDTGIRSAPPRIRAAIAELGKRPQDVSAIVLTHAHSDHTGGAAELVGDTGTGITVHTDDARYVASGTTPPRDRSTLLGKLLRWGELTMPASPVEVELHEGQLLEDSGLEVHHTPGHTPGHVSLLHRPSDTLITGDAIWNMRGRRTWPVLAFCTSARQTKETAATLADLDYRNAAFTHGPEIRGTGREAVRLFLAHPARFSSLR